MQLVNSLLSEADMEVQNVTVPPPPSWLLCIDSHVELGSEINMFAALFQKQFFCVQHL